MTLLHHVEANAAAAAAVSAAAWCLQECDAAAVLVWY